MNKGKLGMIATRLNPLLHLFRKGITIPSLNYTPDPCHMTLVIDQVQYTCI